MDTPAGGFLQSHSIFWVRAVCQLRLPMQPNPNTWVPPILYCVQTSTWTGFMSLAQEQLAVSSLHCWPRMATMWPWLCEEQTSVNCSMAFGTQSLANKPKSSRQACRWSWQHKRHLSITWSLPPKLKTQRRRLRPSNIAGHLPPLLYFWKMAWRGKSLWLRQACQ